MMMFCIKTGWDAVECLIDLKLILILKLEVLHTIQPGMCVVGVVSGWYYNMFRA